MAKRGYGARAFGGVVLEVISWSQARALGLKRYFTGKPCKHGHVAERQVSSLTCLGCLAPKRKAWNCANPEKMAQYKRRHAETAAGREVNRKASARVRAANPGKATEWARANPGKARASKAGWKARNPDAVARDAADRNLRRVQATPPWADRLAIRAIYEKAAEVERATGALHEVDHAIPLRHPRVCGLHIPRNLRVITAAENSAKNNKLIPSLALDLSAPGWAHLHPQAA